MAVAQPSTIVAFTSMKSIEASDSTDTSSRQTSGKESILPFSRAGDSPGQWFQLFNVLEQPELPGWPLLTPMKVQMQKCEKCSREFCAPINYRRHVRVHRRSLNVDKDSHKIRDVLAAFWDKLSLEEAKEVVSFEDVMLKEVPGSSVIKAWATSIRKPGVWTLPQDYVRSGTTLLDIIHAKPSGLPISSQELFCILDDASERTFLCAGTAESVQKYIFDGDVAKIALELKNLVACISFLFEQKLVKAFVADKDAEALRCQKLLVEEEEAAQKRLTELLEKKKQRKLRQKEQKAKGQSHGEKPVLDVAANSLQESVVVETVSHSAPLDSNSDAPDTLADAFSIEELCHFSDNENYIDGEARIDLSEGLASSCAPNAEPHTDSSQVRRRWRVPKSHKNRRNGFHEGQNLQPDQLETLQKLIPLKGRGVTENNNKVWTKKLRMENDDDASRYRSEDTVSQPDMNKSELIIGSISVSVPVRNYISPRNDLSLKDARSGTNTEQCTQKKSNDSKEQASADNRQSTGGRTVYKQWKPLNGNETRAQLPIQSVEDFENDIVAEKLADRAVSDGSCQQSFGSNENYSLIKDSSNHGKSKERLPSLSEVIAGTPGLEVSSFAARSFLAERWKDAISADHVKLVLSPEPETTPGGSTQAVMTSANVCARAKIRKKPEKGEKMKYIPKQKVAA